MLLDISHFKCDLDIPLSRLKKSASKFQPRSLVVELERILIIYKLQHPLGSGGNNVVVVAAVVLEISRFDFLCALYVLRNVGLDWVLVCEIFKKYDRQETSRSC